MPTIPITNNVVWTCACELMAQANPNATIMNKWLLETLERQLHNRPPAPLVSCIVDLHRLSLDQGKLNWAAVFSALIANLICIKP